MLKNKNPKSIQGQVTKIQMMADFLSETMMEEVL